ncbi:MULTISPECIES: hypothetical protein [Clostridium]|uniref:hypothetical protein n=1 Tax=Clostridium TaxID=1485 RepID=UPI00037CE95C|nr:MULTISPECIES: hypothetical protein [Clostridium]MBN1035722.1 hypothetical protein [Clostridium botulinum]NFH89865.1 hypothetical protein [Clostridium botulinum]NFI18429.1 hypothetical protein [Clostridium botulinum]NFI51695.1 hypothetical protein [Clostridium botulinum]NFL94355.1 hypothetical protein [Clostridium botulinum]
MKRLVLILITLICFTTLIGCQKGANNIKLVYEPLSEKEECLLNLTENKILMYKLNNIPGDIKYNISLIYEVYKNTEKIKEEVIMDFMQDEPNVKINNEKLGLNIKNNEIKFINGKEGAYAIGSYNLEEDLSKYSKAFLMNNANLAIGTDIYIYYATLGDGIRMDIPLGIPVDLSDINDLLKDNEYTVLIKVSYEEI